jgi:hypothetical protein
MDEHDGDARTRQRLQRLGGKGQVASVHVDKIRNSPGSDHRTLDRGAAKCGDPYGATVYPDDSQCDLQRRRSR